MKKIILLLILTLILAPAKALAICPVCTIAVGAGVGLARWLKIDDTITGLWIGGLLVSLSLWTIEYFRKKKWNFVAMPGIVTLFYYAIVIIPLYYSEIIGHPLNTIWGIDRLLFGILAGSIFFFTASVWYYQIKKKRGKALFPFQKVVWTISPLIILSIIFYFLTKG